MSLTDPAITCWPCYTRFGLALGLCRRNQRIAHTLEFYSECFDDDLRAALVESLASANPEGRDVA